MADACRIGVIFDRVADFPSRLISALLRKRPKRCGAANRRFGPVADSCIPTDRVVIGHIIVHEDRRPTPSVAAEITKRSVSCWHCRAIRARPLRVVKKRGVGVGRMAKAPVEGRYAPPTKYFLST